MIPQGARVFVCTKAIDMRKGFDGLSAAARDLLDEAPENGGLFVFVSRSATRMKVLWWDRTGYCLLYKRHEWGVFKVPSPTDGGASVIIDVRELAAIIEGIGLPPKNHRMYAQAAKQAIDTFTKAQSVATSNL